MNSEWVNSIVLVSKPDGTIRLCLDLKDWSKAIKRNQWYSRIMDDILQELAHLIYHTLTGTPLEFWHVPLGLLSSLLNTFNMPWGKFRWLRLPFDLKVSSTVFQERLDKVIGLLPGVIGIADDILTYGRSEIEHNGRLIPLLAAVQENAIQIPRLQIVWTEVNCTMPES